MKRIAWTVETLRIKRNELVKRKLEIKKLNLDDDLLKELLNIEVALEDLDEIIFELENENSFEIIKPKEALKDINKTFNRNRHFINQIAIFDSIVDKQYKLLEHCHETKPLQISRNDYLSLVFDFFRSTDKVIFEAFLKNFKDEHKFLNFENYNTNSENTNYGLTYSVRGINLSFLKIFDHKDLETILTIPHEYVHALVFSLNQKRLYTEKSLNFSELEPYFFEFLAEDYFEKTLNNKKIKVIEIQRSRGYSTRESITIQKLEKVIKFIKAINNEVIIMIDNCYCEFVDTKEPIEIGADVVIGSLIKNLGGGVASNGAYVVGRKHFINLIAERLTAPG